MSFDKYADNYSDILDKSVTLSGESSAYFAEYKARYVAGALGREFAGKILDYGCGVGLMAGKLKEYMNKAHVHGYDMSQKSIERVPESLLAQGTFTTDSKAVADDFSAVVVANVLHHVPVNERHDVIRDITRRLTAGGRIFIFEHNPFNIVTRKVVRDCPFDADAVLLRPSETLSLIKAGGMKDAQCDYIVFFPKFVSFLRPMERYLAGIPLGAQYVVTGVMS